MPTDVAAAEEGAAWQTARRRDRPARRRRRRRRPAVVPRRRLDAGVRRLGADELRRAHAARRRRRPRPAAVAAARRRRRRRDRSTAPFSAFVFKVQANMDPSHRDRLAFARICSGRFERGMTRHVRPHRPRAHHQVRHHRVRRRPRDGRGGVSRATSSASSTPPACSSATRSTPATPVDVPADPAVLARGVRHRPTARHGSVQAVPQGPRAARRGGRGAGAARPRLGDTDADPRRRRRSCSSRCSATAWPASSARRPRSSAPATRRSGAPTRRRRRACATSAASASCAASDGALVALFENRYRLARLEADEPELHARTARRRRADAGLMPAASR